MENQKTNPIAVLISDVHYNVHTLSLADAAMRMAIRIANDLDVPLIVAGDLHDTKANLRGECVNAMLETFNLCKTPCFILRGNHDSLNEKSKENALNFLEGEAWEYGESQSYRTIVNVPLSHSVLNLNIKSVHLIPYYHDPEELKVYLSTVPKGSTLIMHQGCQGSKSGDYVQDKSALPAECFADFRVISGHYHTRQDIKCGRPQKGCVGLFSYIGNPYTLGYGEAYDPPKGFQVLMSDGSLEFIPTNLRKHIIVDIMVGDLDHPDMWQYNYVVDDLLWVKLRGDKEYLNISRSQIANCMEINPNFKLTLHPTDAGTEVDNTLNLSQGPLFDSLIDGLKNTSDERKARLKSLWRAM